jgi:hypothetical protein
VPGERSTDHNERICYVLFGHSAPGISGGAAAASRPHPTDFVR